MVTVNKLCCFLNVVTVYIKYFLANIFDVSGSRCHHVNISRVRESTARLLRACVCARRGGQETTATAAGCAGRGGAGRPGQQRSTGEVEGWTGWRPDNTVTRIHNTLRHHTRGATATSRLDNQGIEEPSRTDARIHTSYMTHSERKSWNRKRVSHVWLMSHTVSPMPVSSHGAIS